MGIPGIDTGGGAFQGSSGAGGGTAGTGWQSFGPVKFGSMATGIDMRWIVAAIVAVTMMFFAYLVWG